jgi:hypothetical protein
LASSRQPLVSKGATKGNSIRRSSICSICMLRLLDMVRNQVTLFAATAAVVRGL